MPSRPTALFCFPQTYTRGSADGFFPRLQKKGSGKSGSEMQRDKEAVAAKMREKQAAGTKRFSYCQLGSPIGLPWTRGISMAN